MEEPRSKLEIQPLAKPARIPKEKLSELKGAASAKNIAKMKKEGVICPMNNETVSFVICFSCDKFVRRVKGFVHCYG